MLRARRPRKPLPVTWMGEWPARKPVGSVSVWGMEEREEVCRWWGEGWT